jgi:hypothetical protein
MVGIARVRAKVPRSLTLFAALSSFGCLVDRSSDTPMPTGETGGSSGKAGGAAGAAGRAGGAGGMPDETGGSAGVAGAASGRGGTAAGTGGTGAGDGGAAGSAVACMPNPTPFDCAGTKVPAWGEPPGMARGTLIDFGSYSADGDWGSSSNGELTGGTSLYHGPNDTDLTLQADAASLRLTGSITPTGYVGIVFWFRPCIDASDFTGIAFTVGGTTGRAVMKAQIQTHANYPVDVPSSKGGCSFQDCDTKFMQCSGPTYQLVVPRTPETTDIPWSAFTAGRPNPRVTPEGLVGLQYQLECQSGTDCDFDITLGNVNLTIALAE